jgi:hypothetical protein
MDVGTGIPLGHVFQRGWTAGRLLCPFATATAIELRMAPACVPDTSQTLSSFRQGSIRRPTRFNPESVELQAGMHTRLVENCAKTQATRGARSKKEPSRLQATSCPCLASESVEIHSGVCRTSAGMHTPMVENCAKTQAKARARSKKEPRRLRAGFCPCLAPESVEIHSGVCRTSSWDAYAHG